MQTDTNGGTGVTGQTKRKKIVNQRLPQNITYLKNIEFSYSSCLNIKNRVHFSKNKLPLSFYFLGKNYHQFFRFFSISVSFLNILTYFPPIYAESFFIFSNLLNLFGEAIWRNCFNTIVFKLVFKNYSFSAEYALKIVENKKYTSLKQIYQYISEFFASTENSIHFVSYILC